MLIDEFLPAYHVSEYHDIVVGASVARVYRALRTADFGASPIIRALFLLRGLPLLLQQNSSPQQPRQLTLERFLSSGFVLLGERPEQELLIGLVGRFWTLRGGMLRVPPEQFTDFAAPGYTKGARTFALVPETAGGIRVATETRVLCTDAVSRKHFRRYWTMIRPWSGLIRREMLRTIKRAAEQT